LQRLRQMPLANSPRLGPVSLADMLGDKVILPDGQEKPPIAEGEVKAAFRDTKPEELESSAQAILDSIALVKEIDGILTAAVGANRAINMEALTNLLLEIQKGLLPYVPKLAEQVLGEAGVAAEGEESGPISGAIRSRQDVIQVLERICDYYARTEPSSP